MLPLNKHKIAANSTAESAPAPGFTVIRVYSPSNPNASNTNPACIANGCSSLAFFPRPNSRNATDIPYIGTANNTANAAYSSGCAAEKPPAVVKIKPNDSTIASKNAPQKTASPNANTLVTLPTFRIRFCKGMGEKPIQYQASPTHRTGTTT